LICFEKPLKNAYLTLPMVGFGVVFEQLVGGGQNLGNGRALAKSRER
jgi:hypothetical protein